MAPSVGITALAALATPQENPYADLPTTKVVRGRLIATVTASGNVVSGATASLQLPGTGGIVEEVFVATGDKAAQGDELVRIDPTAAQRQLNTALAQLRSAEASLQTATQGRSPAERTADSAQIATAAQALKNAEGALTATKDSYRLAKQQQAELVAAAQEAVDAAWKPVGSGEAQLADLKAKLAAADRADTGGIATLEAQLADLEARLSADRLNLSSAKSSLAQAKRTRETALQQAKQAVTTQTGSRDSAKRSLAQAQVEAILDARHRTTADDRDYAILNSASFLNAASTITGIFTILLGAIAGVSLLVGGIGVMNIMLVTVTERTREIGIRKAIGAGKADIIGQFLLEAVMLSVLGGVAGIGFGYLATLVEISGFRVVIAGYSVVLAFGFAFAVGLFFGIYPAMRAASLRPIDALRYE